MLTTSSTDDFNPTATEEANKTTEKNDLIKAVSSSLASAGTLQDTDKIDGGEGSDIFQIQLDKDFGGFASKAGVTNVETVTIDGSGDRTFDAKGIVGATTYNLNSTKKIDISNIDTLGTVNVNGTQEATSMTIGFDATTVSGSNDSVTLGLKDVGTAKEGTTAEVAASIDMAGIENVTLNTSGTNVAELDGVAAKNLLLSGSGDTKITAVATSVESLDASAATGKLDVNISASTALAANATIKGGTGTEDNVTIGTTAATNYKMSGFESVTLAANTVNNVVFVGSDVSDLQTINTDATSDKQTTFTQMGAADLTVNAKGGTTAGGDLILDNTGTVDLNLSASDAAVLAKNVNEDSVAAFTFKTTDKVTVNVNEYVEVKTGAITADKADEVVLNVASGQNAAKTELTEFNAVLNAAKAKTITVDAQGKLGAATEIKAATATKATVTTGETASTLKLTTVKLEDLTLTANSDLALTGSDLKGLQTADITLNNAKTITVPNLAKLTSLTITGTVDDSITTSDESSAIKTGDLGTATNNYDLTVTATGLDGDATGKGLEIGTVNTGKNITLDLAGVAGEILVGNIGTAATNKNVTVTSTSSKDAVEVGDVLATGDVTITANATKAVLVGTVGDSTNTKGDVKVDISSEKGSVEVGAINSKEGNITVDAKSTFAAAGGTVEVADAGINGAGDVTITTSNVNTGASVEIAKTGNIVAKGDVTITDTSKSTIKIGAINASNNITLGGDVTIDLGARAAAQTATIGNIKGDTVALNHNGVVIAATAPTIAAHTAANIEGDFTTKNAYEITHTAATNAATETVAAKNLAVDIIGGIDADKFTVTGATTTEAITVTGDLKSVFDTDASKIIGTNQDGIIVAAAGSNTEKMTINISALSNYNLSEIGGGAKDDIIIGGAGVDQIKAGAGADTITGGAGKDIFIFATTDSIYGTALDKITDFNFGEEADTIKFGADVTIAATDVTALVAGSNANITAGGKITFHGEDNTYAKKVAAIQADTGFDAANNIGFFEDAGNTYVYNANAVETADAAGNADDIIIELTGVTGLTTITVNLTDITIA